MRERASRLQRSALAVPATSTHFFAKAAACAADCLFLDLEDAVAPSRRAEARTNSATALREVDWGAKTVSVRINGLATPWALADLMAVAREPRLDLVLVSKVETAQDVAFVDRLIAMVEMESPRQRPLGIEVLIETAKGLANVEAIAAASPRLEALVFGVGDYSVELESFDTRFGTPNADYAVGGHLNDQWAFALSRIANAARAYGLRPVDGPYADYRDVEGYRAAALRARALGFEGKWAIHPSQIALANTAFSPRPAEVAWARAIMAQMAEAHAEGAGALGLDGMLVDQAHIKLAGKILARAALAGEAPA